MSFITAEIAAQPEAWRRAGPLAKSLAAVLPAPGEVVAVVGCGTSWFMAQAYARLREGDGHGRTDAFAASDFARDRHYDRVVAITRSGTTTEILQLLKATDAPTVAITADPETAISSVADYVVDLSYADEQSVVQTLFATTTLTLLRAHLGHDVAPLADAASTVLEVTLDPAWMDAEQLTFLGTGWAYGIAREAALKMREACLAWTEAYPSAEYRHGPISIADTGRVVWHLGPGRSLLSAEVLATGASYVYHGMDPQVDLVLVQRLAAARAEQAGLDPDHPRHLSRSVVLASELPSDG